MNDTAMMAGTTEEADLIKPELKTPRAAAAAGIIFSVLFATGLVLIRLAVPIMPLEPGNWLAERLVYVKWALKLLPFAGIAFLWFIGVVRDRLGDREDRLFATVFLGSGLLFVGMIFTTSAVVEGIILLHGFSPARLMESGIYAFARAFSYQLMNIYALKMAAVFMMLTSTLSLRTGIAPRWLVLVGYLSAAVLIFNFGGLYWAPLIFPLWVLLVSLWILRANND